MYRWGPKHRITTKNQHHLYIKQLICVEMVLTVVNQLLKILYFVYNLLTRKFYRPFILILSSFYNISMSVT